MLHCPNKNLKEWKDLVISIGEDQAYFEWNKSESNVDRPPLFDSKGAMVGDEDYNALDDDYVSNNDELESLKNKDYVEFGIKKQEVKQEIKQITAQEQLFYKRISRLHKLYASESDLGKKEKIKQDLELTSNLLEKSKNPQLSKEAYKEFGEHTLELAKAKLYFIKNGTSVAKDEDIQYINDVLDVWDGFKGLRDSVADIREDLQSTMDSFLVDEVNNYWTGKEDVSIEDIKKQNRDIGTFKYWTGSLIDLPNYIAHAIGSIIKRSQNNIERKTNEIFDEITNKINDISTKSGKNIQDIYNEIISTNEKTDTKQLVLETDNLSEGAKEFYYFYQEKMEELIAITPTFTKKNDSGDIETYMLSKYFIPNITKEESLKVKLDKSIKSGFGLVGERNLGDTIKDQEDKADIIELDYIKKVSINKKSDDLGSSLFAFAKSMYNYDEMSKSLPKVRLLQREIERQSYTQNSNPNFTKTGKDSNLFKMTEAAINSQIKGERKLAQGKSITWGKKTDINGVETEKYLDLTGTLDNLLRWNSILRIGLSPIGATANISFGKLSNFMEAIGGRFFDRKDLRKAELIYWKQTNDKNSVLNKELLGKYNILQELTDYEQSQNLKVGKKKYLSKENIEEIMYSPQKMGEKWIQSSTLLAVMLKNEYLDSNGDLTDKFKNSTQQEKEQLFNKITGINNKLHGRYSPKESAAMQQHIVYRMVTQFRKWLPAAVEARFDEKHFDPRLGVEVEGRYRTFGREFLLKLVKGDLSNAFYNLMMPMINAKKALESGKMSESDIYNMRKMLAESILALGTMIMYGLGTGSSDDDKERRKQAWFKSSMLLLNRVSGDLAFFYSPDQINNIGKNAIPMTKLIGDLISVGTGLPKAFSDEKLKSNEKPYLEKVIRLVPGSKIIIDPLKILSKKSLPELNY